MPEPEELTEEREAILKWSAVTKQEWWDETVQALAEMRCREANMVCVDHTQSDAARLAAAGKFQAWSEVLGLRKQWELAYAAMREQDAQPESKEELVGAKLEEQWYEHQDEG